MHIEDLTGYKKYDTIKIFPGYERFPGCGRPGIKTCINSCRNPGYGIFPGYGDFSVYVDYPGYES